MKFYITIILCIILNSCREKEILLNTIDLIELGKVKQGDTLYFNIPLYNKSHIHDIKLKKISVECSCTILYNHSDVIKKNDSLVLKGIFIASKTEYGNKSNKLVINSTADNTFNIVKVNATIEK